jgi:hypothetical protein
MLKRALLCCPVDTSFPGSHALHLHYAATAVDSLIWNPPACRITVTFKDDKDGTVKTVQAPMGKSILEVAHENDVELEGELESYLWVLFVEHGIMLFCVSQGCSSPFSAAACVWCACGAVPQVCCCRGVPCVTGTQQVAKHTPARPCLSSELQVPARAHWRAPHAT